MAFSIRQLISSIGAFKQDKKPDELDKHLTKRRHTMLPGDSLCMSFEEPDSTSRQTALSVPQSVVNFASKKGSLSDTDVLAMADNKARRKCKKLKIDVKQARAVTDTMGSSYEDSNIENTPKHVLLDCPNDLYSERLKSFDFNKSFPSDEAVSDENRSSPFLDENLNMKSASDDDSDVSADRSSPIKMCRKVDTHETTSTTSESFGKVEVDSNEEDRLNNILKSVMQFENINCVYNKLLNDLKFNIDYKNLFNTRSIVTLPGTDVSSIPNNLGEITYMDNISRGPSPTGSWNIVMENEDEEAKTKLKNLLQSMKRSLAFFIRHHLKTGKDNKKTKDSDQDTQSITFDLPKGERVFQRKYRVNSKKLIKYFDFPDLRVPLLNLFTLDSERDDTSVSGNNVTALLSDGDECDTPKCNCNCHTPADTDSGVTNKSDNSLSSITSSLGNFSLDSSTLTAYSESLDQIVSYNSFQDTSLYNTLLQKAAIERITFYVQVHSIQMHCEQADQEFESKNVITFYCPFCLTTETEENGLLKHILSQIHCEKIHFQYKTAYIKKCMSTGKEIQPSTVLNSMVMYRDVNKIVCFGDAVYACSLCFENPIVGEATLMSHCWEPEHLDRRARLCDILE